MFERPNTLTLSGVDFPIKCDLVVLEKIQDTYGSITEFENMIYRFIPELDEDGNFVKNSEDTIMGRVVTPADLKPLFNALLWMVEEGCEIAKERGDEVPEYTPEKLKRMVDMPPYQLSEELHEEFTRAFERKN